MKILVLTGLLAFPFQSHADGTMNGGGGKGVMCQTANGPRLEALEVYEARELYKLEPAELKGDFLAEFAFGMDRLNEVWGNPGQKFPSIPRDEAQKILDREFISKRIDIPVGRRLPLTEDATLPVVALGCEVVQVALWNNLGIQVDTEYWQMMDARNQAALVYHELLYFVGRLYGSRDSDLIRQFVGRLFSVKPPTPRFEGAKDHDYLSCVSGGSGVPANDFIVYVDDQDHTVISFRELEGVTTLGRTAITIGGRAVYDGLVDPNTFSGLGMQLKSEFGYETRGFNIKKPSGGNQIETYVYDNYSGRKGPVASGFCTKL